MKQIAQLLVLMFLLLSTTLFSQITFNACHSLLENQNYTFNQIGSDSTGRNIFETNPVTGDQDCGGIGICEMQIVWNDINNRWEIFADDGNGTFLNTYVLYYNTEASLPNPPSLNLGTWIEEASITQTLCGAIITLSGDVQDAALGITDLQLENLLSVYPNPVNNILNIKHVGLVLNEVSIYNVLGKLVYYNYSSDKINMSKLNSGVYFVKIRLENKEVIKKIIIN